jgi:NosR/NirI family nitrous oxide reductase transcriptional regulator
LEERKNVPTLQLSADDIHRAYLFFILVWLGWYANAQLSVVNVLTFANSLLTGFS